MSEFSKDDMTLLVQAIQKEKCVFFLGPGATINFGQGDLLDQFLGQELKASLPPTFQKSIVAYNPGDRFFVLDKPSSRNKLYQPIKDFYAQERSNPLLDKLAEVPFHMAISVTPDMSLNQAFKRRNIAFSHQYFDKAVCRELPEPPTKAKPLLYNLFGCILADETLITTHLDLFETLRSMFEGGRIPKDLLQRLGTNQLWHVIFLGFEFDKWYYQLILYLLNLHNDALERIAMDPDDAIEPHTKAFYEADFHINFIAKKDLLSFVDELHACFQPAELRGGSQPQAATKSYNRPNIYALLDNGFTVGDLSVFIFKYFPEVANQFTPGMTKSQWIQLLMQDCERVGKFDALLAHCDRENPAVYLQYAPYHG